MHMIDMVLTWYAHSTLHHLSAIGPGREGIATEDGLLETLMGLARYICMYLFISSSAEIATSMYRLKQQERYRT